jgi:hypothetical protein
VFGGRGGKTAQRLPKGYVAEKTKNRQRFFDFSEKLEKVSRRRPDREGGGEVPQSPYNGDLSRVTGYPD